MRVATRALRRGRYPRQRPDRGEFRGAASARRGLRRNIPAGWLRGWAVDPHNENRQGPARHSHARRARQLLSGQAALGAAENERGGNAFGGGGQEENAVEFALELDATNVLGQGALFELRLDLGL